MKSRKFPPLGRQGTVPSTTDAGQSPTLFSGPTRIAREKATTIKANRVKPRRILVLGLNAKGVGGGKGKAWKVLQDERGRGGDEMDGVDEEAYPGA